MGYIAHPCHTFKLASLYVLKKTQYGYISSEFINIYGPLPKAYNPCLAISWIEGVIVQPKVCITLYVIFAKLLYQFDIL